MGFVTFSTRASAEHAKADLQSGVRFDPDLPQTIRLEFAKSNTKVSKPKQQSSPPAPATHPALAVHTLTGRKYIFFLSFFLFFSFIFLLFYFPAVSHATLNHYTRQFTETSAGEGETKIPSSLLTREAGIIKRPLDETFRQLSL